MTSYKAPGRTNIKDMMQVSAHVSSCSLKQDRGQCGVVWHRSIQLGDPEESQIRMFPKPHVLPLPHATSLTKSLLDGTQKTLLFLQEVQLIKSTSTWLSHISGILNEMWCNANIKISSIRAIFNPSNPYKGFLFY